MSQPKTKFQFPIDDLHWGENLNKYSTARKNLPFPPQSKPHIITQIEKNEWERVYNPLTQKYINKDLEKNITYNEHKTLTHSLSQCYDNAWRYEQTYNVINLKDKLRGLECSPIYPKYTPDYEKPNKSHHLSNYTNCNFNVLSNKNLLEHNNIPYENRPKLEWETPNAGRLKQVSSSNYKDYNIISNNYNDNNELKQQVDKEANIWHAADWINQRKDFDVIRCRYYNPKEETNREIWEKNKDKHLTNKPRYQGQLYNPINMNVYDKEALSRKDSETANKKLRFHIRPEFEKFYQRKGFEDELRREEKRKNRADYKRYQEQDKRGYDLINKTSKYKYYKNNFVLNNNKDEWEKIMEGKGENETLTKKEIYKEGDNKADQDEKIFRFKIRRNREMEKWLPIKEDPNYKKMMANNSQRNWFSTGNKRDDGNDGNKIGLQMESRGG